MTLAEEAKAAFFRRPHAKTLSVAAIAKQVDPKAVRVPDADDPFDQGRCISFSDGSTLWCKGAGRNLQLTPR